MNRKFTLLLTLLFFSIFYAQKMTIDATDLNVRQNPDKNANVIGKLSKNDTISIVETNGDWVKFNYNGGFGYVNKDYLKIATTNDSKTKGFKYGFWKSFPTIGIIMAILVYWRRYYKKDGRFKGGYNKNPLNEFQFIGWAGITLGITTVLCTIVGVCFWITNLFS